MPLVDRKVSCESNPELICTFVVAGGKQQRRLRLLGKRFQQVCGGQGDRAVIGAGLAECFDDQTGVLWAALESAGRVGNGLCGQSQFGRNVTRVRAGHGEGRW